MDSTRTFAPNESGFFSPRTTNFSSWDPSGRPFFMKIGWWYRLEGFQNSTMVGSFAPSTKASAQPPSGVTAPRSRTWLPVNLAVMVAPAVSVVWSDLAEEAGFVSPTQDPV